MATNTCTVMTCETEGRVVVLADDGYARSAVDLSPSAAALLVSALLDGIADLAESADQRCATSFRNQRRA